jgi:hypothetical protein
MAQGFYFFCDVKEKNAFKVGCHVVNVTWLSPFFRFFSLLSWREKKSKSKFRSDCIFFGLGRFSIYWVVGLLKSFFFFFWQEALKRWVPCRDQFEIDSHGFGV